MTVLPVSIRLNPFKKINGDLPILQGADPVPWNKYGYILRERPIFTLHPLFHAGCYYVQDSSAMYVGHIFRKLLPLLGGTQGLIRVLDLCAAPGGKTTDLAASLREAYGNNFSLVSNEVMKDRVKVLDENVAKWGDPNIIVTSVDPAAFAQFEGYFDIIVADVPCSGEGMFRKDERAVQEWSEATVDLCASRQKRILADAWPSLRQGGILIYSTCTYEQSENDDNLEWAANNLGGQIIAPEAEFSQYGVTLTEYGHILKAGESLGEGQWVGALVKTAAQSTKHKYDINLLRPRRIGITKGEYKGKDFVPNPDWALNLDFDYSYFPIANVDKETALHFLHKDGITLTNNPLGYNTICYKGVALGFVKNLGKRCNNLYPSNRRILMNI